MLSIPATALAGGEMGPGSYCPLPEKGEVSSCLAPAQAEYGEFFTALGDAEESDELDTSAAALESEVAKGASGERAYLALSSLSYGYYQLAQRAAATPGEDPQVVARLERWNALLSRAYDVSGDDERYRSAVREAATDIDARVDTRLSCRDAEGTSVACDSTEHVLRGINAESRRTGIRGALERMIERFTRGDDS